MLWIVSLVSQNYYQIIPKCMKKLNRGRHSSFQQNSKYASAYMVKYKIMFQTYWIFQYEVCCWNAGKSNEYGTVLALYLERARLGIRKSWYLRKCCNDFSELSPSIVHPRFFMEYFYRHLVESAFTQLCWHCSIGACSHIEIEWT